MIPKRCAIVVPQPGDSRKIIHLSEVEMKHPDFRAGFEAAQTRNQQGWDQKSDAWKIGWWLGLNGQNCYIGFSEERVTKAFAAEPDSVVHVPGPETQGGRSLEQA